MSIYYLRLRCYLKPSHWWLSQRYYSMMSRANITAVLSKDVQLQSFYALLPPTAAPHLVHQQWLHGVHTHNLSSASHKYIPALGSCEAQDTSSPTPTTAAAKREHCSSAPLGGQRDTWRGWINCMYKSQSSASTFATRFLRNADSRQAKNRPEGAPLETRAHTALLIIVCWYLYSLIAVYFIKKM